MEIRAPNIDLQGMGEGEREERDLNVLTYACSDLCIGEILFLVYGLMVIC